MPGGLMFAPVHRRSRSSHLYDAMRPDWDGGTGRRRAASDRLTHPSALRAVPEDAASSPGTSADGPHRDATDMKRPRPPAAPSAAEGSARGTSATPAGVESGGPARQVVALGEAGCLPC